MSSSTMGVQWDPYSSGRLCEREARVHKEYITGPPNLHRKCPGKLSEETAFWLSFQAFVGKAKQKSKNQESERRGMVKTGSSSR